MLLAAQWHPRETYTVTLPNSSRRANVGAFSSSVLGDTGLPSVLTIARLLRSPTRARRLQRAAVPMSDPSESPGRLQRAMLVATVGSRSLVSGVHHGDTLQQDGRGLTRQLQRSVYTSAPRAAARPPRGLKRGCGHERSVAARSAEDPKAKRSHSCIS